MVDRRYYSDRHGRRPETPRLSLDELKRAAKVYLLGIESEGYFQQYLGHSCVDTGFSPGLIGGEPGTEVLLTLGKANLWPLTATIDAWREDDLFDMVEYLFAHVSKPTERHWHAWDGCGWHCTAFDTIEGKSEFRNQLNRLLHAYASGFELTEAGEVLAIPPTGLEPLVEATLEHPDAANVVGRVSAALHRFRRHRASRTDRRAAVRELADVLEFLRDDLRRVLTRQDEQDLFNIANNFGVRHHRADQRTDYDPEVWLDWIFYYYLATIHAAVRLIERGPN